MSRSGTGRVTGSRMLGVHGFQVRVLLEGDGDPLLLLNGLTRPLESWEPFTQALTGRTVIRCDAPGVGGSPASRLPLSMSLLAQIAASVLDDTGVERADVLGFSHGGAVAQQLVIDAPERVRRLVLVSTSPGFGATAGRQPALRGLATARDGRPWPDVLGTIWLTLAISSWSSIPSLGSIAAPTLVVSGAHDQVVPPENSRLLARRIPGAQLALLPAGHDLQRTGPAGLLADAVEQFLSSP